MSNATLPFICSLPENLSAREELIDFINSHSGHNSLSPQEYVMSGLFQEHATGYLNNFSGSIAFNIEDVKTVINTTAE
jgi:hypothetical protein